MRKQFNLQDWLKDKSQKVETKDGRPVRIVCWDAKGTQPIIGLIYDPNKMCDIADSFCENGKYFSFSGSDSAKDLFLITPEPELSEFEKAVDAIYESCGVKELQVKKKAAELLALAREELFANDAVLKEYAEVAREQGKAEALKDLPRWRQIKDCDTVVRESHVGTNMIGEKMLYIGSNCISISTLEKLPGFKED